MNKEVKCPMCSKVLDIVTDGNREPNYYCYNPHCGYEHIGEMENIVKRDSNFWDCYFMGMAEYVAEASKDPSTRVGAVIVDEHNRVTGTGFNGLPRGYPDYERVLNNRELKLDRIIHAEVNAISNSYNTKNCTIYIYPLFSCNSCAKHIVNSGIKRVVSKKPDFSKSDFKFDVSIELYKNSGIQFTYFD